MAIVRWDPFREFGGAWMPPVDIYSTGEHELVIKAEIPGMNKDDLDITVENFTLTIRGEKKAEQTIKDEQFHRVERSYGTFTRSFALPHTVDPNRVAGRIQGRRAQHQASPSRRGEAEADQGQRRCVSSDVDSGLGLGIRD